MIEINEKQKSNNININSKKILFYDVQEKKNYERSFGYKDLRLPCSIASLTSMCNVVQSYVVRYKGVSAECFNRKIYQGREFSPYANFITSNFVTVVFQNYI